MIVGCLFILFFNDTATTEIYTLSLHDALPICAHTRREVRCRLFDFEHDRALGTLHYELEHAVSRVRLFLDDGDGADAIEDRKSTRLNSSHANISYAVFCLKKKNTYNTHILIYN